MAIIEIARTPKADVKGVCKDAQGHGESLAKSRPRRAKAHKNQSDNEEPKRDKSPSSHPKSSALLRMLSRWRFTGRLTSPGVRVRQNLA